MFLNNVLKQPTLDQRYELLTINGRRYDFVPVNFYKLLNAPANRMVKKTLE